MQKNSICDDFFLLLQRSYPVPCIGAILPLLVLGLRLRFLEASIREGMLVKAIGSKWTRSAALVEIPTGLTPEDGQKINKITIKSMKV